VFSIHNIFGIRAWARSGKIKAAVFENFFAVAAKMTTEGNFMQPSIPCFDGHYDHWSMLMENFLRSKELWGLVEIDYEEPTSG
jgi:hypothetical protein